MNASSETLAIDAKPIKTLENIWIPLADGRRLAARIWRPVDAPAVPVPAVTEFVPYRERDELIRRRCRSVLTPGLRVT